MKLTLAADNQNVTTLRRRGTRWPAGETVPSEWLEEGAAVRARSNLPAIDLALEAEKFCDYWTAKSGAGATKLDWRATWRNWCRNARGVPLRAAAPVVDEQAAYKRVELALKGIVTAGLERRDVMLALGAGRITPEQARRLGV